MTHFQLFLLRVNFALILSFTLLATHQTSYRLTGNVSSIISESAISFSWILKLLVEGLFICKYYIWSANWHWTFPYILPDTNGLVEHMNTACLCKFKDLQIQCFHCFTTVQLKINVCSHVQQSIYEALSEMSGVNGSPHISVDFLKCLQQHIQTIQHFYSLFKTERKRCYFRALKSSSLQKSTPDVAH